MANHKEEALKNIDELIEMWEKRLRTDTVASKTKRVAEMITGSDHTALKNNAIREILPVLYQLQELLNKLTAPNLTLEEAVKIETQLDNCLEDLRKLKKFAYENGGMWEQFRKGSLFVDTNSDGYTVMTEKKLSIEHKGKGQHSVSQNYVDFIDKSSAIDKSILGFMSDDPGMKFRRNAFAVLQDIKNEQQMLDKFKGNQEVITTTTFVAGQDYDSNVMAEAIDAANKICQAEDEELKILRGEIKSLQVGPLSAQHASRGEMEASQLRALQTLLTRFQEIKQSYRKERSELISAFATGKTENVRAVVAKYAPVTNPVSNQEQSRKPGPK